MATSDSEKAALQWACDAVIARLQSGRGGRVQRRQACVHGWPADGAGLLLEPRAHGRIGQRQIVKTFDECLRVEQGAADQQRLMSAGADLADQTSRIGREAGGRVRLGGLDQVDQVVRDRGPLGQRRLGGADVHAAIDQRRVDADDLDRPVRGQGHRCGALARGGRAEQHEHRPFIRSATVRTIQRDRRDRRGRRDRHDRHDRLSARRSGPGRRHAGYRRRIQPG